MRNDDTVTRWVPCCECDEGATLVTGSPQDFHDSPEWWCHDCDRKHNPGDYAEPENRSSDDR